MSESQPPIDLREVESLLERCDRRFDEEYRRNPEEIVEGFILSIDQLRNALLKFDDPSIDAVRNELKSIRSELTTVQGPVTRAEYDRLSGLYWKLIQQDPRVARCEREINEIHYMHVLLLRTGDLESRAKTRQLTQDELDQLAWLPEELAASQRKVAELREHN